MNIKRLRAKVILKEPFFSSLLQKVKIEEKKDIPVTAFTDEYNIYVGENFDSFSEEQQLGVIMHELLHIAFLHVTRMKKQNLNQDVWNIATDLIVNELLKESGYSLPEGIVDSSVVSNYFNYDYNKRHSAEMVYNELLKKFETKKVGIGVQSEESGECNQESSPKEVLGRFKDLQPSEDKSYTNKHSQKIKEAVMEGVVIAKTMGKGSTNIVQIMEELLKPQINWKKVLRSKIYNSLEKMFAISRKFNKRKSYLFGYDAIYEKTKYSGVNIVSVIDTSGSMSDREIKSCLTEILGILKQFNINKMTVIQHDYHVQDIRKVSMNDLKKFEIKGRGGTSFIPVLKELKNYPKSIVVWFTDGWGDQNDDEFRQTYKSLPHDFVWVIINRDGIEKITPNIYEVR